MYNGIGLTTPRGSGTNGHVQRNWAFVRPGKKDNSNYRSEEDIKKLDATLNRPPNKDILDHDRKRKIEVKCLEFEEILEKQGLSSDEIKSKVDTYREKLMGQGKSDIPKDDFGRILVRDSHQIAEAQQEKNAKLREAFNISEYFVEGSSFDSDRKAKEDLAKSLALQKELDIQRDQAAAASAKEKEPSKRYTLVRTPSMEHDISSGGLGGEAVDNDVNIIKKKKKKRMRESSVSPDRKKDKKKKSKKRKKESKPKKSKKFRKRKTSESESNAENDKKDTFDDDSESEIEAEAKKSRKKNKKEKRKRKNKKKELSLSSDNSISASSVGKPIESKDNETLKWNNINEYEFRSRSKEKSQKEAHDRFSRRSHIRSDRNKTKLRSSSRSDKNVSNQSRIERSDRSCHDLRDSYQKLGSCSKGYRSRGHQDSTRNDKNLENRRSRSLQRSKRIIGTELCLKRKHSEDYSQRKSNSPVVDERKRYSRSHSTSLTRQNCGKKSYSQTESKSSRARSRTPKKTFSDSRRKINKSRSKSKSGSISVVANLRKKSLTPPLQTSERVESKKYIFKSKEKCDADLTSYRHKDKRPRSRTISASSLNTASFTGTRTSKSRTYSPKREHTEKDLTVKIFDTQKFVEKRQNSQSPSRTPTPATRRSESRSRIEASRSDKYHCGSISEELLDKSKEKREEQKHLLSRTPPPFKVEKKIVSPRSSRDSSELSYSPARRNPERYRDILENSKIEKTDKCKISDKDKEKEGIVKSSKQIEERDCDRKEKGGKSDRSQAKPIVRLQSQSDEDSDVPERNTEKILDEFLESKRDRELKDLKILEQLKTDIAAKAKEKIKTIEKMCASTSTNASLNNDGEPLVAALADSSLVDAIVSKVSTATVAAAESAARRSRSRSRRSRSRNRHVEKTSSGGSNKCGSSGERDANRRRSTSHSRSSRSSTSSRSRSRSQSRRSSRSRSSQSSSSSHTSSRSSSSSSFGSSRSGTRSPSIPRRRGSPSFLDRRRITSRHSSNRDRRR